MPCFANNRAKRWMSGIGAVIMILSASRRTDIPCHYSDWFINRLKAGYVLTRNPMNYAQVSKIPLSPDVVDCIVFWTKDAKNIMTKLKTLDNMNYNYYFQFTLTPYCNDIEKNLRTKADIENTFITLSKTIGKERVLWRYDPIILNGSLTINYHKEQFIRLCEKLHNYTENVTISFVDMYRKLKTKDIRLINNAQIAELSANIRQTAQSYGLIAKACCEKMDLSVFGIEKASCIDKSVIEKVCGYKLDVKADKNQREDCGCIQSIDIGTYNTCKNGCVYCYANYSDSIVENSCYKHSPCSDILIGTVEANEKIIERKMKLLRNEQ
jgi:hypothetical protein